ncbi:MAG: SigB/SigF/SigG family RNA polymerase sigma factor [Clostridia bacterium]|nr:SigB/SigF/SigG family RNA polymerase sigma factor [Clostridia bacterium]
MRADTLKLVIEAQNGDESAFEKLINDNVALVKSVVKKYLNRGIEYDDLYQLGCMGLVKCIKRFDTAYDVEFSTYAVPMIAGEIKRFLRDDGIIKVSRSIKENAIKIDRIRSCFLDECGREPTVCELSEKSGIKVEDIVMALEATKGCVSIYEPIYGDETNALVMDKIYDRKNEVQGTVDKIMLRQMLDLLSDEERKLILLRYFKDMTQTQTAKILNISQVQVSRLESKIMKKLKNTY